MKGIWLLVVVSIATLASLPVTAAPRGETFAFLVVCSDYSNEFRTLPGTLDDMKEFRQTLIDSGVPEANIKFLHDKAERRYTAGPRVFPQNRVCSARSQAP